MLGGSRPTPIKIRIESEGMGETGRRQALIPY